MKKFRKRFKAKHHRRRSRVKRYYTVSRGGIRL